MVEKKKIAIVGPESTGKTTLAKQLANEFEDNWAPEFARDYLESLGRPYQQKDLREIALGQMQLEDRVFGSSKRILFCDTNLLVIKIWSLIKYKNVDADIEHWLNKRKYDLYLLTSPDIPWEPDPQRENPYDRDHLFKVYVQLLEQAGVPFSIIQGDSKNRLSSAKTKVTNLLQEH